jgi:hypothetical protein
MSRDMDDILREEGADAARAFRDGAKRFEPRAGDRGNGDAEDSNWEPESTTIPDGVTIDDFIAYMPKHCYLFRPCREAWPGSSVNACVPPVALVDAHGEPVLDSKGNPKKIPATQWLDEHQRAEQMTWAPGEPELIRNRLISEGGWIARDGVTCYNLYRPPVLKPGDKALASPWVDHVQCVFPDDAHHITRFLAHRVQHPAVKANHALVLGGRQGIGKDTLLEPVKRAVGPWNVAEVSPSHLLGRFNAFVKSVILRVSEIHDLGDSNRYALYEHLKVYTAAPPDVLRVDEKHIREYSVLNCCAVVVTTNHLTDGLFLPADDRRHYVAWSDRTKEDFTDAYWTELYGWYDDGGDRHVMAYLAALDLAAFNPKAPPPKTPAFWQIVDANRAPEAGEMADLLDDIGRPDAVTIERLTLRASGEFAVWLHQLANRKLVGFRLDDCGYVKVLNLDDKSDGLWRINGRRQAVYARKELPISEQIRAATALARPS